VVLDHAVDLAVAGQDELQAEAEAVQRRLAQPEVAQPRQGHARAPGVVFVLDRLRGDVVAEPLGLLVGVGVTADVDQQCRVVDDRPLLVVESQAVGQPQRDEALAQHVLHRLPETEVDPERERGDQLRKPGVRAIGRGRGRHAAEDKTRRAATRAYA
jgi:hypothetical protein